MIRGGTAVVLAGGESRRFGADKRLAPWRGGRLVEAAVENAARLFPAVLVAAKKPEELSFLERPGVRVIADGRDAHALGGLLAGLAEMDTPHAFAVGGDMPLVNPGLVRLLWDLRDRAPAVIPHWDGRPQPLCAVYSRDCLAEGERRAAEGRFSLRDLAESVGAHVVPEETLRAADPDGLSFLDADTPAALEEISLFSVGKNPLDNMRDFRRM